MNGHIVHKMPSSASIGMEDDEDQRFDSPEDEIAYYRDKYRQAVDGLIETRAELDEFQASSKELEDELERELAATEKHQAELKEKINRLEAEKEEWKTKLIALQKQHSSTTAAMQREMDNLRSERDKTLVALRDLEMGNDELERNERVAVSSLLDLESKYNRAIEEKTLLEQEVVQRQELEDDVQRLKDELRDANNEISILRDQISRAVPTPPSSIGMSMSPVQEASRELSPIEPPLPPDKDPVPLPDRQSAPTPTRIPRSNTSSSIPTLSPATKRYSGLVHSPTISTLSRSINTRNLVNAAASPAVQRTRSILAPSPAKTVNPNQVAKSKGFKLLHDLQARLKATDDKLGTRVPKSRNVSAPMPLGISKRSVSTSTSNQNQNQNQPQSQSQIISHSRTESQYGRVSHARVAALQDTTLTPMQGDKSGNTLLSPNGWVMIEDGEDTPTNNIQANLAFMQEPTSPLEMNFRAVSSASNSSNRSLPSRPAIPSPLATLIRSTSRNVPSSISISNSTSTSNYASHTISKNNSPTSPPMKNSRPMSPSMLPQPRNNFRAPSPSIMSTLSSLPSQPISLSRSSSRTDTNTRPSSRIGTRPPSRSSDFRDVRIDRRAQSALGKGPPPTSTTHPDSRPLGMSVSTSAPSGMKRSARRSSVGVGELLPASGIPLPKTSPGRPVSVPLFQAVPPPVPRIPSVHLREKRTTVLGLPIDRRAPRKSGYE
ncbi:hypothetical protein TREMEDRAFT_25219 [Tremella mesenterica DSM 1558]|uniref:uncharacterized protein n=1 Tax=Tremella mesenterica (strain ATCC 24925 / CBS 8224 / DSM 1558 / NBRC 9311 / NRRL Y-6157 / RJB 2259-6 / UBC 559-6) TaxID=578456 RepID=UPI0003F49228|nr:uncharacterized protein TREMEDRAFT_25219 [Tremella mesenterica DSM 1558]EIW71989.1 hypothetical protein TREMEDRAFT_25219 [Tremella mesenterica DSM 1558]